MTSLMIRNVEVEGRPCLDVAIRDGLISAIGPGLPNSGGDIDGGGGALIPGLADHHIHLLATGAREESCVLDDIVGMDALKERIVSAVKRRTPGSWLRATGLAPDLAYRMTPEMLGQWVPDHPVRIQDQSGGLWILNPRALKELCAPELAEGVEQDASGRPTGRLWRADDWLRAMLGPAAAPSLAALGARLAACGVTALTDASASNDAASAQILTDAVRCGDVPQRLTIMSAAPLTGPEDGAFAVGPVKLLLDERDLPSLDEIVETIRIAREQDRNVAVHCVTAAELAITMAGFLSAGARYGDRIEHGGIIPAEAIETLLALRLTVVTQPGFILARGDRYLRDVPPGEQPDLYRAGSLIARGVPTAFSSDAPYGPLDPWQAIQAATHRCTNAGLPLGRGERISAAGALRCYWGSRTDPGGPQRRVEVGAPADLCLLAVPLADVGQNPDSSLVRATIINGKTAYLA